MQHYTFQDQASINLRSLALSHKSACNVASTGNILDCIIFIDSTDY